MRARRTREVVGRSVAGGETSAGEALGETKEVCHDFYAQVEDVSTVEMVGNGGEAAAIEGQGVNRNGKNRRENMILVVSMTSEARPRGASSGTTSRLPVRWGRADSAGRNSNMETATRHNFASGKRY